MFYVDVEDIEYFQVQLFVVSAADAVDKWQHQMGPAASLPGHRGSLPSHASAAWMRCPMQPWLVFDRSEFLYGMYVTSLMRLPAQCSGHIFSR